MPCILPRPAARRLEKWKLSRGSCLPPAAPAPAAPDRRATSARLDLARLESAPGWQSAGCAAGGGLAPALIGRQPGVDWPPDSPPRRTACRAAARAGRRPARMAWSAYSAASSGLPLAAAKLSKSRRVDGDIDRPCMANMLFSSSLCHSFLLFFTLLTGVTLKSSKRVKKSEKEWKRAEKREQKEQFCHTGPEKTSIPYVLSGRRARRPGSCRRSRGNRG